MALSLPSAVFAFKGPSELHQAVLMCTMSFTSAWVAAVGLPMLVELAPNGRKGGVLAWQMAVEDVWGVILAAVVGVCAPKILHLPLPGAATSMLTSLQQLVMDTPDPGSFEEPHDAWLLDVFGVLELS